MKTLSAFFWAPYGNKNRWICHFLYFSYVDIPFTTSWLPLLRRRLSADYDAQCGNWRNFLHLKFLHEINLDKFTVTKHAILAVKYLEPKSKFTPLSKIDFSSKILVRENFLYFHTVLLWRETITHTLQTFGKRLRLAILSYYTQKTFQSRTCWPTLLISRLEISQAELENNVSNYYKSKTSWLVKIGHQTCPIWMWNYLDFGCCMILQLSTL